MNFFHVPSFEDHFTLKIWLKNWNLSVNKSLFKLIHKLNHFFNESLGRDFYQDVMTSPVAQSLFVKNETRDRPLRFQIYIKDDFDSKEEIQTHFYRKMHFLVYVVLVESKDNKSVLQLISNLKKFAFIKEIKSLIVIAICKTSTGETLFRDLSNCLVLRHPREFDHKLFAARLVPIFKSLLLDKLRELPPFNSDYLVLGPGAFLDKAREMDFSLLQAKVLKLKGDISMIFGKELNALNYFSKSRAVLKVCHETRRRSGRHSSTLEMWRASIAEGESAYVYRKLTEKWDPVLFNRLVSLQAEAKKIYQEDSEPLLDYELCLKMLGFQSFHKRKESFIQAFFDLRRAIIKVQPDPRIFLYIGDLAHNCGLDRMAVCSLFECFRQAKRRPDLDSIVYECLNLGAKIMGLDVDNYNNDYARLDRIPEEIANVLLTNLLSDNCQSKNNEKTLHFYLLLLKKNHRDDPEWIIKEITEKIIWEAPFYHYEYDVLPFVQRIVPLTKEKMFILNSAKAQTETDQTKRKSVFIYDPRLKVSSMDLNWMEQQEAEVLIYLTNPLNAYVRVDSVFLETEHVALASFSKEIFLEPLQSNFELRMKVKPINSGMMRIKGVRLRMGNLLYVNRTDSQGIGLIYKYVKRDFPFAYEKHFKSKKLNLDRIVVSENVPILSLEVQNIVHQTVFFNETLGIQYRLSNSSHTKCLGLRFHLRIDFENAPTFTTSAEFPSLSLEVNEAMPVSVQVFQRPPAADHVSHFRLLEDARLELVHFARNYIERVYKITLSVESSFPSNVYYAGLQKSVQYFKNYRLFDFQISQADLFAVAPLPELGGANQITTGSRTFRVDACSTSSSR